MSPAKSPSSHSDSSPAEDAEPGESQLRVLVVDDQLLVRAGICELVKAISGLAVVGEASDGSEALRLIGKHNPDLVLMDIAMPGMNGLEALALATTQFPRTRIILLAESANEEYRSRAVRAGAAGFVVKSEPVDNFYAAIKVVGGGGHHLMYEAGQQQQSLTGQAAVIEKSIVNLTPRQREVLRHVAQGRSTKEIASLLGLSVNTVKTHRLRLMESLGVHEISALVRYAARLGLLNKQ